MKGKNKMDVILPNNFCLEMSIILWANSKYLELFE